MTVTQVRRKRRRLRREIRYGLYGLAVILLVVSVFTTFIPLVDRIRLTNLGYSKESIRTIREQRLSRAVLSREYSKAFDENMAKGIQVGEEFELYFVNTEVDEDLIRLKHVLMKKGYEESELLKGFAALKFREMTPLLVYNNVENLEEYIADVLANRGKEPFIKNSYTLFYENSQTVEDQNASDILVNKYHNLETTFVPELVNCSVIYASEGVSLHPQAYDAFKSLVQAMKADGLAGIYITSGYRSYQTQANLYNRYVKNRGQEWADNYSARAGSSEHQTGLAADVTATDQPRTSFDETPQYEWMKSHAHEYGFILRYTVQNQSVTGYEYEPWHYRYLGRELAEKVQDSGLTYDEYYELYLREYPVE